MSLQGDAKNHHNNLRTSVGLTAKKNPENHWPDDDHYFFWQFAVF